MWICCFDTHHRWWIACAKFIRTCVFIFGRTEAYALSEEIRLWVLERYRLVEKVFGTAAKKTHSCLNPLVKLTKDMKNRARKIDRQELMSDVDQKPATGNPCMPAYQQRPSIVVA